MLNNEQKERGTIQMEDIKKAVKKIKINKICEKDNQKGRKGQRCDKKDQKNTLITLIYKKRRQSATITEQYISHQFV